MCVHSLSKTILRLEFIILQHIKIRFITIDGQSYTIFRQIKKETSINKRFYINKILKKVAILYLNVYTFQPIMWSNYPYSVYLLVQLWD